MGLRLYHSVEINAPVDAVWRVITDFSGYSEWSGFKGELSGAVKRGAFIKVVARPRPGKLKITFFRITICEPPHQLEWDALYGPFWSLSGKRFFIIEELGPRQVRLTTGEEYRGWVLPFLRRNLEQNGPAGFAKFCAALKARAEGM